ncbi:MAG: hypothetical protein WKF99_00015 [Solirubrobacteraceae bacterium]
MPRQARETQQRGVLAQPGQERGGDHHEVEHVPAAAEEVLRPPSVGGDAYGQLDHEDRQEDGVDRAEHRAEVALHAVVGLQAQHDGVGEDHREDRDVEALGLHQPRARPHHRRALVAVDRVVDGDGHRDGRLRRIGRP